MKKVFNSFRGSHLPQQICSILKTSLTLITILIFIQTNIYSEIRYVSKTGSSTPPYLSWSTAADSIQKCIDISNSGDTIYVGNGVYKEKAKMITGLSLIGMGTDSCVIDMVALATSEPNAIEMSDSCLVSGFRIIFAENVPNNGVGIYMNFLDSSKGNVVVDNLIMYATTGIVITEGKIKHNYLYKTKFAFVGAVFDFSHQYTANIDSNYASFYSIAIQVLEETVIKAVGNIFLIENYIYGGKIMDNTLSGSSTPVFSNNLILSVNNVLSDRAINNAYPGNFTNNVFLARFQNVFNTYPSTIINNIVVGSQNAGYIGGSTVKYNNFWKVNTYPNDSTNISVNPMFVDDISDYHLQKYSHLIDAGDPSILDKDSSRSDIGLYGGPYGESYIYQDLPPRTPVNFSAGIYGEYILLNWNKNIETDFQIYKLYRDTIPGFPLSHQTLLAGLIDTTYTDQIPSSANRLYYKVTAVDSQGNESNPTPEIAFIINEVNEKQILTDNYILYQNYPNPFNPSTKIGFRLNKSGYVKLYVYDLTGSEIAVLVNETKEPGYYETEFNAGNLASGMYFYKIQVTDWEKGTPVFTEIKRMVLLN